MPTFLTARAETLEKQGVIGFLCGGPDGEGSEVLSFTRIEPHDDLYVRIVKKYYFPLLHRYHRHILVLWLIVFIICLVYGPAFLSDTRSDLSLPKGTDSAAAVVAFQANYPSASTWPPAFIVAHTSSGSIVNEFTKELSASLDSFASSHSRIVSYVSGYWEYIDQPELKLLANDSVSADRTTMVSTISFTQAASLTDITNLATDLLNFAHDHTSSAVSVGCTGLQPLFEELSQATASSLGTIDGIVLPIAIIILGCNLRSYRHILVTICNLGCTLLLAFALLVPITFAVTINPFAPSIMMSLGIAVCFDYSLFMLARFREEIMWNRKSKEEAVLSMLVASGHVVMLSGCTIFFTFALLLAFPQNFLQSVGWGCGAIVLTAVFSNMTVSPALLLAFDCLSRFELFPDTKSFFCYVTKDAPSIQGLAESDARLTSALFASPFSWWPFSLLSGTAAQQTSPRDLSVEQATAGAAAHNNIIEEDVESGGSVAIKGSSASSVVVDLKGVSSTAAPLPGDDATVEPPCTAEKVVEVDDIDIPREYRKSPRTFWFHIAFFVTKYPLIVVAVASAVAIPFAVEFSKMQPTADDNVVFLRGSDSLQTYNLMSASFPVGQIDPYSIIVSTGVTNAVLTQAYFDTEKSLIKTLLTTESGFIDSTSITALSFFKGQYVTLNTSLSYLTATSSLYNSTEAAAYRLRVGGLPNPKFSTSLIQVVTIVSPDSQAIVPFILNVRTTLKSYESDPVSSSLPVQLYLFGGYTSTYDIEVVLYKLVPVMIATTIVVVLLLVGYTFGSVGMPIRLAITVLIGLCFTYGLTTIVYQPGPGQRAFEVLTPDLSYSIGVYWLIPIMAFSVLIGLALDYDIFLMSRVMEFRRLGWSDRAAVCLAVDKTGNIITTAGLIMSISFAGQLVLKTTVLNQYGFILFIGVATDTFIIRTLIVPAVITMIGSGGFDIKLSSEKSHRVDLNWWPTMMPQPMLTPEEEIAALLAGYAIPPTSEVLAKDPESAKFISPESQRLRQKVLEAAPQQQEEDEEVIHAAAVARRKEEEEKDCGLSPV